LYWGRAVDVLEDKVDEDVGLTGKIVSEVDPSNTVDVVWVVESLSELVVSVVEEGSGLAVTVELICSKETFFFFWNADILLYALCTCNSNIRQILPENIFV